MFLLRQRNNKVLVIPTYLAIENMFIFLLCFMSPKKSSSKQAANNVKKDIEGIEDKVDDTMDSIATKIDGKVGKDTKAKAKKVMEKADAVAEEVDEFIGHIDDLTDHIIPHGEGTTATFEAEWTEDISRLFIFRCLWMIIQGVIIGVWGVWIAIITVMHWIYMLLFGKRERNLRNRQVRFVNHFIKRKAYTSGLTDERPDMITPESN
jgi:hypothetical protein